VNDERLERELKAALLQDDPGAASRELRMRVAAVPDEAQPRRGFDFGPRFSLMLRSARAISAVALIGAVAVIVVSLHNSTVNPGPSGSPSNSSVSQTPSGSATATPTGSPLATPTGASKTSAPANGPWADLRWSAPSSLPGAFDITGIVAWNGDLIALGDVQGSGSKLEPAMWRSSGGTDWTGVSLDAATFADARISSLLATPSGLLAVGWVGEPVCTGQGAGTTCGPTPVMLWTSPDGVKWTRVPDISMFEGATISAVDVGPRGLVAVGDTGWSSPAIWTSNTGTVWQRQTLPAATFKDAHFSAVRVTPSGFVIGGSTGDSAPTPGGVQPPSTGVAAAWWSPDGQTWTKATVNRSGGLGTSLGAIEVGSRGLVAVGSASGGKGGVAWTSTDGHTWDPIGVAYYGATPAPTGVPELPSFTIHDDGTHLIAFGDYVGGRGLPIWVSSDGSAWQQLSFSGATDTLPANFGNVWLVPGGLTATGGLGSAQVWGATALP
jgi:hypothetical protein